MPIKLFPSVFIWVFNKDQSPSILHETTTPEKNQTQFRNPLDIKKISASSSSAVSVVGGNMISPVVALPQPPPTKRKFRKSPRMKQRSKRK